jgi:hypothetical protein
VRPCNPDCPKDFECVPWGAGDLVNVCVYVRGELCDPCQSSAACQGPGHSDAQCVRYGDLGSFCGLSCTANSECGDGWLCRSVASIEGTASKQCVRGPGDAGGEFGLCPCSKVAVSKGLATACLAGFVAADGGKVSCGGSRKCAKEGSDGLTACNAPLPAT